MELHRFKSGTSEIRSSPVSSLRTSLTVTAISCRACVPANKNMRLRPREGILRVLEWAPAAAAPSQGWRQRALAPCTGNGESVFVQPQDCAWSRVGAHREGLSCPQGQTALRTRTGLHTHSTCLLIQLCPGWQNSPVCVYLRCKLNIKLRSTILCFLLRDCWWSRDASQPTLCQFDSNLKINVY